MKGKQLLEQEFPHRLGIMLAVVAITLGSAAGAHATEKVLHTFAGTDGAYPTSALIFDAAGNMYGITEEGGNVTGSCSPTCGTVFRLSPNQSGGWTTTVLHTFNVNEGYFPLRSGLVLDSAGNLYGTTGLGGQAHAGTVFELSPMSNGQWRQIVLHSFSGGDGDFPEGKLVFDAAGNLYGATRSGGNLAACLGNGCGVVYELSPSSGGGWKQTVLYSFNGDSDGGNPIAGLIFDAAGNLYGTTASGGKVDVGFCGAANGCGTVFKLTPSSSGSWTETVIYAFSGVDGYSPAGELIADATGNLYGPTQLGGNLAGCLGSGCGVIYELSPSGAERWTEKVLFSFPPGPSGEGGNAGSDPPAALAFDTVGNLYGTAASAGSSKYGVAFKLSPNPSGEWTQTVLHAFSDGKDGGAPVTGLTLDSEGDVFGTTANGGVIGGCSGGGGRGCGVVFEIMP